MFRKIQLVAEAPNEMNTESEISRVSKGVLDELDVCQWPSPLHLHRSCTLSDCIVNCLGHRPCQTCVTYRLARDLISPLEDCKNAPIKFGEIHYRHQTCLEFMRALNDPRSPLPFYCSSTKCQSFLGNRQCTMNMGSGHHF